MPKSNDFPDAGLKLVDAFGVGGVGIFGFVVRGTYLLVLELRYGMDVKGDAVFGAAADALKNKQEAVKKLVESAGTWLSVPGWRAAPRPWRPHRRHSRR